MGHAGVKRFVVLLVRDERAIMEHISVALIRMHVDLLYGPDSVLGSILATLMVLLCVLLRRFPGAQYFRVDIVVLAVLLIQQVLNAVKLVATLWVVNG